MLKEKVQQRLIDGDRPASWSLARCAGQRVNREVCQSAMCVGRTMIWVFDGWIDGEVSTRS